MADEEREGGQSERIADRTIWGVGQIIERALNYVDGLERTMVMRGIQVLYPRIEQRIRRASDEDLSTELKYVRGLIDRILDEPKSAVQKKRKRANKRTVRKPGTKKS